MNLKGLVAKHFLSSLSPDTKYAARRMCEDAVPSLAFALNKPRQRQTRRALVKCQSVEDLMSFTQRYLGVGSVQHLAEIDHTLKYLQSTSPRVVCEIGTEHGGTTLLLSHMLPQVELLIGVDLYIKHAPHLHVLKPHGQKLRLLCGSSYSPTMVGRVLKTLCGRKIDVLFIDGDHRYDGVKKDFLLYRHLVRDGGFIVFHDIVPDHGRRFAKPTLAWAGGVPLLWERLKTFYDYHEFVQDGSQDGLGIGVLRYSSEVLVPHTFIESQDDATAYPYLERVKTC